MDDYMGKNNGVVAYAGQASNLQKCFQRFREHHLVCRSNASYYENLTVKEFSDETGIQFIEAAYYDGPARSEVINALESNLIVYFTYIDPNRCLNSKRGTTDSRSIKKWVYTIIIPDDYELTSKHDIWISSWLEKVDPLQ